MFLVVFCAESVYLLNSIPAALNLFVMKDSFSNIFSEKRSVLLHELLAFISRTRRRARAHYLLY